MRKLGPYEGCSTAQYGIAPSTWASSCLMLKFAPPNASKEGMCCRVGAVSSATDSADAHPVTLTPITHL